jgi:hypothetical protein
MYEKPEIKVDVWPEIQFNVFISVKVGEFLNRYAVQALTEVYIVE